MAASGVFHIKVFVFWTGGIAVNVVTDLFEGAFVPWIVRNEGPGEMKLIFESTINFNGIESGITQKGMRVETGMGSLEVVIEKGNMSDNTETVSENGKFISITEMTIDIELLGIRRGRSLGGHEGIGHSIRVNIRVIFIVGFEPFDEGIESFSIVFRDIKFNAGSIEGKGVGKGGINGHTDGFREIDQMLKEVFDIRKEFLFKTSEKRGIGSLTEAAKVSKFFGEGKKKNEKGWKRSSEE